VSPARSNGNAQWQELNGVLSPKFEIVEPASLPYGGVDRNRLFFVCMPSYTR
jgi:hypothetical protein